MRARHDAALSNARRRGGEQWCQREMALRAMIIYARRVARRDVVTRGDNVVLRYAISYAADMMPCGNSRHTIRYEGNDAITETHELAVLRAMLRDTRDEREYCATLRVDYRRVRGNDGVHVMAANTSGERGDRCDASLHASIRRDRRRRYEARC